MNKNSVRKQILSKRNNLSAQKVNLLSNKIIDQFKKTIVFNSKIKNVACYFSFQNEVETKKLINYLIGKDLKVCVPKLVKNKYHLVVLNKETSFSPGKFGIMEPDSDKMINVKNVDMAIFPALAFNVNGARLGWGKGIYDRLFVKTKCKKIGLAYNFQITDFKANNFDLIMDIIITEKEIYKFNGI